MHRQPDSDLLRSRKLCEPVGQVPDLPSSAPTAPWQVGDLPHVAHTVSTTIENTGPTSGGLRPVCGPAAPGLCPSYTEGLGTGEVNVFICNSFVWQARCSQERDAPYHNACLDPCRADSGFGDHSPQGLTRRPDSNLYQHCPGPRDRILQRLAGTFDIQALYDPGPGSLEGTL